MRARGGFTLIELLVVIAIIAILAAILFPVFLRAKQRAQMAACQSNMKQLASAIVLYANDWGGYFVMTHRGPTWQDEKADAFWAYGIRKYCADKKDLPYCLTTPPFYNAVGGPMQWRYYWGTTIGMNVALGEEANNTFIPPVRVDQVRAPTKTIMLGDASHYWYGKEDPQRFIDMGVQASQVGHWAIVPGLRTSRALGSRKDLNPGLYWTNDFFDPKRHDGLVNIACVDGHVVAKTRLWLLDVHATDKNSSDYTWWDVPLTPDQLRQCR